MLLSRQVTIENKTWILPRESCILAMLPFHGVELELKEVYISTVLFHEFMDVSNILEKISDFFKVGKSCWPCIT